MDVGKINRSTRNFGAPRDWDPAKHGPCGGLPIRDQEHRKGVPSMVSAWFPTEWELKALQAGAPVLLHVIGVTHPPVALEVGVTAKEAERI